MLLVDKSYCSQSDVERAMGVAAAETNVTQAMILSAIKSASDEVDLITHTRYLSTEDSGTATGGELGVGGAPDKLFDTGKSWTTNEWADFVVWMYGGTGSGQYARITSNNATELTLTDEIDTAPDATTTYRIVPDVIRDEDYDGNDLDKFYLPYYPIIELLTLTVESTSVTPAQVTIYNNKGMLKLDKGNLSPESSLFTDAYGKCIGVKWVYGVYPIPRNIIRLTAAIAAIQCLITQIGGTYNDVTSYSIPHFTASKGEPYVNIREALVRCDNEVKRILKSIIKRPVVV